MHPNNFLDDFTATPNGPNHYPVMVEEVVSALITDPNGCYVDATYGRGGHSSAILRQLADKGKLLSMDKDPQAFTASPLKDSHNRLELIQSCFSQLHEQILQRSWQGRVHGILFDLGVSSPQFEQPERGFSFRFDGPLDMRFDPATGISAATWINSASEKEIGNVLKKYGEEPAYRRISRAIVEQRTQTPIENTRQLAELVAHVARHSKRTHHPATQTFQAIRIHINQELENLDKVLPQALDCLEPGGRLAVISFHSLEDRAVKRFLRHQSHEKQPWPVTPEPSRIRLIGKTQKPSAGEIAVNPRARSAILRIGEKIK